MHELESATPVGVLVPSGNPVVEPELRWLLPPSITLHAARFPVMPGTTLLERNRRYLELYPETLEAFGDLALRAVVIGLTGPSYRLLPEADAALAARLSTAGRPVQTASNAIRLALQRLGARRICLLSPYPQWLTDEAAAYWTAAGHDVTQVVKVEAPRAYDLTTSQVEAALRSVSGPCDAIVMSGTGMLTVPAMVARGGLVPVLSSNVCCAWWLMESLGYEPKARSKFSTAWGCPKK